MHGVRGDLTITCPDSCNHMLLPVIRCAPTSSAAMLKLETCANFRQQGCIDQLSPSLPAFEARLMHVQVLGDNLLALIKAYNYRGIPMPLLKRLTHQVWSLWRQQFMPQTVAVQHDRPVLSGLRPSLHMLE